MSTSAPTPTAPRRSFDVLLLFVLLIARLRLNAFAEAGLFEHFQNVARHPLLGGLLSPEAIAAFGPWAGDPIFLLLAALSLLAFVAYVLVDSLAGRLGERLAFRLKLGLLWGIILFLVVLPTLKLALLRHDNLPHSYSHDGGVIQTEITIDYFLSGLNPYVEDYYDTAMADWGFPQFRTALEHYPYLPATFVLSAPLKLLAEAGLGWYDQRFTYLLLFLLTLLAIPRLVGRQRGDWLGATMLLGLNPIMGLDILFGQNDSFVLAWIVLSLWFLQARRPGWSALFFGVACAAKPTAWFLAPFWALALLPEAHLRGRDLRRLMPRLLRDAAPALGIFLLMVLPYVVWDAGAFWDDTWRWAAGSAETHYQIWGLGFANFVLASGALSDRFAYWPFWIPELLAGAPLLLFFLNRQRKANTLANVCWHGGLLLLVFAYFSRFLNENYLGFVLALLILGYYAVSRRPDPA